MDNNLNENLKKSIEELIFKMDLEAKVEIDASQPDFLIVNIESEEAGLLIGQGGENLSALQHIARIVFNKKQGLNPANFIIDTNNYRAHRLGLLKEMALSFARQVINDGQSKMLEPMSAYERRVVHLALKDFNGVETESQGEGHSRRIVIKPAGDAIKE